MRKYLLSIDTEKEVSWEEFKKTYKQQGLGTNLDEAIMSLIKKHNEETKCLNG